MSLREDIVPHIAALRRLAHGLCRHGADAEDLLHDTLERALLHAADFRGTHLKAWLSRIMVNQFRNGLRGQRRRGPHVALDAAMDVPDERPAADPLLQRRLLAALNGLGADSRAVLLLVGVEGFSYAEVSDILEVPIGTVMSRLARARQQMRARLAGDNIVPLRQADQ